MATVLSVPKIERYCLVIVHQQSVDNNPEIQQNLRVRLIVVFKPNLFNPESPRNTIVCSIQVTEDQLIQVTEGQLIQVTEDQSIQVTEDLHPMQ
jgi:hypothetical protein